MLEPRKQRALQLTKTGEQFRAEAYFDTVGNIMTIGYGTTRYPNGAPVKKGDQITEPQAAGLILQFMNVHVFNQLDHVLGQIKPPDAVYAALCSLAYNCPIALEGDSIHQAISAQNWGTFDQESGNATGLCAAFLKYVNTTVDGQRVFSKGLYNRRVLEIKYMLNPPPI